MKITKIVTHDTTFHADEVFGVAIIQLLLPYGYGTGSTVIRTRDKAILAEAIDDPETLVMDVGGVYMPEMLNFDHHQDMNLPSSAGMIWEYFKRFSPYPEEYPYLDSFIAAIDAVDTNRDNIYALLHTLPEGFRNVSSIISGFNRDPNNTKVQNIAFSHAVEFAKSIFKNEMYGAKEWARSEREYAERTILPNNVAVFDTFSTIWKKKGEHQFAVLPHANGWQIQSRDTSVAVVPTTVLACEGFIFRHISGFMATVKDKEVAVNFAMSLPVISPV
jgi:uncharacterized UPF0160 family protein